MKFNFLIVLLLSIILISCNKKTETNIQPIPELIDTALEIPNTIVDNSTLHYNNKTSLWKLNEQLFSGYALSYYQDSTLKEKVGILNGRKQNQTIRWYPDGHFKQVSNYHKGKLHGENKKWSSDTSHIVIAQLNYHFGKGHGQQKIWYPSGELFKKLNLNMGREEGIQQAFRKNGVLYANYEAKEGRTFGLKKAALCFGIEDEIIRYEK